MDVLVLIDKLDDQIHNAKAVPLTDQVRVDKEEIYDILDQMRATIPDELKQARWIVKERQEMLEEAKREADRIVSEARQEQTRLLSEEELVRLAERQAEELLEDARVREREIRLGAEDYADEVLGTLESNLRRFTAAVERGRERLQTREDEQDGQEDEEREPSPAAS
jgi:cell division septum initiation protein DivIVA